MWVYSFRNGIELKKNSKKCSFQFFFHVKFYLFCFCQLRNLGLSLQLDNYKEIKKLWILFLMAPRTNFRLNLFNFYVTTKITHENQVTLNFQVLDHRFSFLYSTSINELYTSGEAIHATGGFHRSIKILGHIGEWFGP